MRRAWTIGGMLAALALPAAGGAQAGTTGGRCARALPQVPAGLPAPIVVTTRCGRFSLEPSGSVVFEGARTLPVPRVAASYSPQDLTWWGFSRGHLLIGRGFQQLWRSHRRYPGTHPYVDAVILGARELAFNYYDRVRRLRLYVARYDGREHRIAEGETPMVFLDSGDLVTWREHSRALVRRAAAGRFERMLATRAGDPQVDRQRGVLLFRTGDDLRVFDGKKVLMLARLRDLGLSRRTTAVEPLGLLVSLHDRNRLVLLEYDGSVVASTVLARHGRTDGVSSSVVANAGGTAVAFTGTVGNEAHEIVYVLSAGERQARAVFDEELHLDGNGCERAAWLAWHGQWLLYSNNEQQAAVVDGSAVAAPIELSGVIAQLPGAQAEGLFDIAWARSR